jgi:hypothetical protein
MEIEKSKSWWPFWSYKLDSAASPGNAPQKWAK